MAICIAPSIIFIGVVDVCSNKYYFDTYPVCGKSAGLYTAYYYLYISGLKYVFSYLERGKEQILIKSEIYEDVECEVAVIMAEEIAFRLRKKKGYLESWNFNGRVFTWRLIWDMKLDLLKKTPPELYQRTKNKFEQEMVTVKKKG